MEDRDVNEESAQRAKEAVPRGRRVRRLAVAVAIVLAVLCVLFFGVRTSFFARGAGRVVSNRFLGGTHFVFTVDRIGGSLLRDVSLEGVRLRYTGPGPSFDLFRAERISIRYGWRSLGRRSGAIDRISLIEPVLSFRADSAGAFILPSFGEGTGELPTLDVDRFDIENARLFVQGKEKSDEIDELNLAGSVRVRATEIRIAFTQGSAAGTGRDFSLRSLTGAVTLVREPRRLGTSAPGASRIILDSLAVSLDESAITASGTIVPSSRLFDLAVDARPIDIGEITRILQIETSHYGDFKGSFTARGMTARFRLEGVANGVVSGYALRDFGVNLLREGGTIRLDSLDGIVNDAGIKGRGSYTFGKPDILTLDVNVQGMDLSKGFVPGKKLPETRFTGAVKLRYNVRDEALTFALDLGAGDFLGFPFAEATMRGSYADDSLTADEILLIDRTHTIRGSGTFAGSDRVSYVFDVDCAASDTIFSYFDIEQYRADATLNGRWEGTLDAWDLRLNGSCANLAYHGALVPVGAVKLAVEKNAEYDVQFDLDGPGCSIGPVKFTGVSLSLDAHGETGTIKRLHLTRDDFAADITAGIETKGTESTVRFKECSFDALGEKWRGGGAFTVVVGDTVVRFDDIQLHSREGAVYLDGAVGRLSKTVRGRFSCERLGLELLDRAGLLATPLAGKAHGTIECSGTYVDPDLDVDLAVEGGRIDTFVVDTLRLKARYARGSSAVDSLVIGSPSGSIELAGRITGMGIRAAIEDPAKALKKASVSIESSCRNLDLVPILSLAGVGKITGGRLNGTISITDSLAHPLVALTGRIERLSVPAFTIPSVDCDVRVDREGITADGMLNISPTQQGEFYGRAPIKEVEFLYALDRLRPVALQLNIPEGDFSALSGVTELVVETAGRYAGRLAVTGTLAAPHLKGDVQLKGASFRISGMEEKYTQVNATITIADSLVTVSQLTAREGKKGSIGCSGTITLSGWKPSEYRITCDANEFVIASLPDILANVSGQVSIGTTVEGGRTLPEITGSCRINEAELYYDLGSFSPSPESGTLELPSYLASVDLAIPGNTWIRTPDARVELQGNVTLHHDGKGTYLRGELNLVRGWYNIYGNKFTITSGKLQFVFAGSFRPVVDIEAETKDPEGRNIYLTLQWHQDDLQPKLTLRHEDPGYSETDIWKMLGGGVVAAEGEPASWSARSTAQSLAANYIERVLNSQMEGVTIELESGRSSGEVGDTGDYRNTKIAIGKYLSQGLYVKYKQGLSISSARQIEVEYRISDLFLIRSEVIRYSDQAIQGNSPGTSDEINVDLKLRWEF